jgi:hypothetical protein
MEPHDAFAATPCYDAATPRQRAPQPLPLGAPGAMATIPMTPHTPSAR